MDTKKTLYHLGWILIKILFGILVVFLVYEYSIASYEFGYRVFNEKPMANPPGKEVVVDINSSISANEIGQLLENKRLIQNGNLFEVQVKLFQYEDKFVSGTYTLTNAMTSKEMMKVLAGEVEETKEEENGK